MVDASTPVILELSADSQPGLTGVSCGAASIGAMESRISAAKARANRANNVILASAAALFLAAAVAARVAHPARPSQPATTSSSSGATSASTGSDDFYGESDDSGDYYGSGSIAPSQSPPQLSTGGS